MTYIEQSLGRHEKILMAARFHWIYTARALFWILAGFGLAFAVGVASVWWDVYSEMKRVYGSRVTGEMWFRVWNHVVRANGGYLKMMWDLPTQYRAFMLAPSVVGVYAFCTMMLVRATTEIAVTNERVIYKKGLLSRQVGELNVDRIEGVSVHQGPIERLLDCGYVSLRGVGVGEVDLPQIASPIAFRRAVNEAKADLEAKNGGSKA